MKSKGKLDAAESFLGAYTTTARICLMALSKFTKSPLTMAVYCAALEELITTVFAVKQSCEEINLFHVNVTKRQKNY